MTQPSLSIYPDTIWLPTKDGNFSAIDIFERHYSCRPTKRKQAQMIGPGEKMLLITPDAGAIFAWRKFIDDSGQDGVNCCVFRNEGTSAGISSDLIKAAMDLAWERWPKERLYTFVDKDKVKSHNPGFCFIKAGWRKCGVTKSGKLIFEFVTEEAKKP